MSGYENALAPSIDFAFKPGITASQVKASMKSRSTPMTASHSRAPALERNPMSSATPKITITEIEFETIEART
ncbi:hypothetical protein D3C72_2083390 [compost metagenome]